MTNLFEQAIEKNELLEFALGKEEYFVVDREYGEHSVINTWINYILPLIDSKGIEYVDEAIENLFKTLLMANIDEPIKNETLLYHLHVYYYLHSQSRIVAQSLKNLNSSIEDSLNAYISNLEKNHDSKASAFINTVKLIQSRGGLSI
jgi:hypothetical protein